jgi:hypothetical protein
MLTLDTAKDAVEYVQLTSNLITGLRKEAADLKAENKNLRKIAEDEYSSERAKAPGDGEEDLNTDAKAKSDAMMNGEKDEGQELAKESSQQALEKQAVDMTVAQMVRAGFIKEADSEDAATKIQADPQALLSCMHKLATDSINSKLPRLGKSAGSDDTPAVNTTLNNQVRESDVQFENHFRSLYPKVATR